jgi:biotin synthase-related radical SAM superfamily protein
MIGLYKKFDDLLHYYPSLLKSNNLFYDTDIKKCMTQIKAHLLTKGVIIDESAVSEIWNGKWKAPRMVRSGMSGGLEFFIISGNYRIAVSCSYYNRNTKYGDLVLFHDGQKFYLAKHDKKILAEVQLIPQPSYYTLKTTSGLPMASIAQQCFSKLAVGVYGRCFLNHNPQTACAFCAIHAATRTDSPIKTDNDIIETVQAAANSELIDVIETVMLGGGTPDTPDRGARRFSSLSARLIKRVPWRITAMLVPPASDAALHFLYDSGVTELSINLEFGSDKAFHQYTPGKAKLIGRKRYFDCLEKAVYIFGDGNVQSLLVTGLEPPEDTLWAVKWLAERKIIPVLSPFRPLPFTLLENQQPPSINETLALYYEAKKIVERYGVFLGPRCPQCQCNTMSLPWDISDNAFLL